jgi:hypothetical protein
MSYTRAPGTALLLENPLQRYRQFDSDSEGIELDELILGNKSSGTHSPVAVEFIE